MLKAKEKIVWRKKKDLLVLLDTESGNYYTLNETAQDLWMSHIVGGQTLDMVVEEIAKKYTDAPPLSMIENDCGLLIEDWKKNALVEEAN
jgi:hypothetical protein